MRPAWIVALVALGLVPSARSDGPIGYFVQSDYQPRQDMYRVDLSTGAVENLGQVGLWDSEGITAVGDRIIAIGGTIEEVWDITQPPGFRVQFTPDRQGIDAGLGYDPTTGKLYNLQAYTPQAGPGNWLYEIEPQRGATLIGSSPWTSADCLAINRHGQAFAADFTAQALYSVDLATGQLSLVGFLGVETYGDCGCDFDPQTDILWAINDGRIFTLDIATGQATYVATSQDYIWMMEGLAVVGRPARSRGEVDGDHAANNFDIDPLVDPFVLELRDPAGDGTASPDSDGVQGDTNQDGRVDDFGLDPFVELLIHQ